MMESRDWISTWCCLGGADITNVAVLVSPHNTMEFRKTIMHTKRIQYYQFPAWVEAWRDRRRDAEFHSFSHKELRRVEQLLQDELEQISTWMQVNRLLLKLFECCNDWLMTGLVVNFYVCHWTTILENYCIRFIFCLSLIRPLQWDYLFLISFP